MATFKDKVKAIKRKGFSKKAATRIAGALVQKMKKNRKYKSRKK